MTRRMLAVGLGLSTLALGGCEELLEELLVTMQELDILGVMPADGFSDPASPDYGQVTLALGGQADDGLRLAPPGDMLEIEPDDGSDVEEGDWEELPGFDEGSFVLLVDGSGSVEASDECEGCPTDPSRLRVEAARALATELGACSGGWRMSLMEFGSDLPSSGYSHTTVLADWTTDTDSVLDAADGLSSYTGTPLWDSTYEVLDALTADATEAFGVDDEPADEPTEPVDDGEVVDEEPAADAGIGIVVLSDGADNESMRSLDELVDHAIALGVPVHTVGFGPASDTSADVDDAAVDGLRHLATETGGYYGFVESVDDLPELTEAVAGALCGGHTELTATFAAPPPSGEMVTGDIVVAGTRVSVPFKFRAP